MIGARTESLAKLFHQLDVYKRQELERLLAESRRSGKRQAAPFSKGDPKAVSYTHLDVYKRQSSWS